MTRQDVVQLAIRGGGALAVQTILSRVVGAIALVFVARLVGPREMAVWAVVSGFGSLGWALADMGIAASLVRGRTEPEPLAFRQAAGMQMVLVCVLFAGALWVLGMFPALRSWVPEAPALILGVFGGMLVRAVATPTRAWLERHMRFTSLAMIELTAGTLQNLTLVVGLLLGMGVWAFAASAVVGDIATLVMTRVFSGTRLLLPAIGLGAVRPYLSFGLALQLNNLAHLARESLTPLILAEVLGPDVAGLWAWVRRLLEVLYSFLNIGWRVTFPAYARMGSARDWQETAASVLQVTHWPLLFLAVALMGAGPWPLDMMFGPQWRPAHPALYIALAGLVFSGPVSVALAGAVLADGGAMRLAAAQALRTLTLWTVALLAGPKWGATGVALGWLTQLAEDALTLLLFARSWRPPVAWMMRSLGTAVIAVTLGNVVRAGRSQWQYSLVSGVLAVLLVLVLNFRILMKAVSANNLVIACRKEDCWSRRRRVREWLTSFFTRVVSIS